MCCFCAEAKEADLAMSNDEKSDGEEAGSDNVGVDDIDIDNDDDDDSDWGDGAPLVPKKKGRPAKAILSPVEVALTEEDIDSSDESAVSSGGDDDDDDDSDGDERGIHCLDDIQWVVGQGLDDEEEVWEGKGTAALLTAGSSAIACFHQCFPVSLLVHIVTETNRYGAFLQAVRGKAQGKEGK